MSSHTLPSLRRETTDDFSAMYTFILDEDDSPALDHWRASSNISDVGLPKLLINTKLPRTSSFYDTTQTSPVSSNSASPSSSSSASSPESHAVSPDLPCIPIVDEQTLQDVANRPHFSEHFFWATCLDPLDSVHLSSTLTAESEYLFMNSDLQNTTVTPDQMHIRSSMHFQEEPKSPNVIKDEEGALMVFDSNTNKIHFECEECPSKVFQRIHDWRRHKESFHSGAGWPCEFCGRKSARRDALLRHLKVKALKKDGIHPIDDQKQLQKEAKARIKKMTLLHEQNE